MKKYVFFVVLALLIIFIASNMPYEQQTIVPELETVLADKPLEAQLSKLEFTYWGRPISVETRGYFYFVEFLIRKGTHFIGFGLVGLLFFLFYRKLGWRFPALLAIGSIFIVASLDEYRQTLIPGRTGMFGDVLIDTAGAIFFVIIIKGFLAIKKR
ncbi:MAG: VanZ family protein, partial [Lysinibacillus sp.]